MAKIVLFFFFIYYLFVYQNYFYKENIKLFKLIIYTLLNEYILKMDRVCLLMFLKIYK